MFGVVRAKRHIVNFTSLKCRSIDRRCMTHIDRDLTLAHLALLLLKQYPCQQMKSCCSVLITLRQAQYVALIHHLCGSYRVWHVDRMGRVLMLQYESSFYDACMHAKSVFDFSQSYALNRCICLVVHLCANYRCALQLRGVSAVWVQLLSFAALLFL